jgi:metal-responsive CopG/Arc/MetJ family transcriptional regulator
METLVAGSTRTTVSLPDELLEAIDSAVHDGKAPSRNAFVALALRHELAAQKRAATDAAFADMAGDGAYQTEALAITAEFAGADAEAFRLAEQRG